MKEKELKINKKLPQIVIPANKLQMFMDWWDNDIRFETHIPKAFEEGYLTYELPSADFTLDFAKEGIKYLAKLNHATYREVESRLKELNSNKTVIYFKFTGDNSMYFERYEENSLRARGNGDFGDNGKEDPKISDLLGAKGLDSLLFHGAMTQDDTTQNILNLFSVFLVTTALWYIATARSTKYIYENKIPVVTSRHKHKSIVQVKPEKTINVPIYDMSKIRIVKTDKLIQRKKGWTYSHAFQVHGHYRHYKSGKVIFINSFIKGKNKELQPQKITLEPKEMTRSSL